MKKLILLLLTIILLSSCELFYLNKAVNKEIYFVSLALDYKFESHINNIPATLNDQKYLFEQVNKICGDKKIPLNYLLFSQKDDDFTSRSNLSYISEASKSDIQDIKEKVLLSLTEISKRLKDDDLLIFHYSGHGKEENGMLVTKWLKKDPMFFNVVPKAPPSSSSFWCKFA